MTSSPLTDRRPGSLEFLVDAVRREALLLDRGPADFDSLLDLVGDARFVLHRRGLARHARVLPRARPAHQAADRGEGLQRRRGRGRLARRLPRQPLRARRVARTRMPRRRCAASSAFPSWMWRNADVLDFVGWLRAHNDGSTAGHTRVGFYGLDLYSLYASIEAVIGYLDKVDPAGAARARERYACFEQFGGESQAYGYAATMGISDSCRRGVMEQLLELQRAACRLRAPATASPPRTSSSTPSRTPGSSRTPRSTTARCSRSGRRRGTCAIATWPTTLDRLPAHLDRHRRPHPDRGLGAQLPRRRCADDRDGRNAAS